MVSLRRDKFGVAAIGSALLVAGLVIAAQAETRSAADVLASATASDYGAPDPANLLIVTLDHGEVLIELAPEFAPEHVKSIRALTQQGYFDDSRILRSQDNYVVQWGDPAADTDDPRPFHDVPEKLAGEYFRDLRGLEITALKEDDAYAPAVGFAHNFPIGYDKRRKRAWLPHCYGMVGVGRGNEADSGNGTSLYVVTGHAPRHLDRNVTLVGRVLTGMPHLSALPRGTGRLGFYTEAEEMTPIRRITLASTLPAEDRPEIYTVKTDTRWFKDWVDARATRTEDWFLDPVGAIGLCNVPLRAVTQLPQAASKD